MEYLFFTLFSAIALISALLVITFRNPVHSVVALIVCFFQVACLFVLLRSPFLAGAQIFIYVGAIMVFFVFAVFLMDFKSSMAKERFGKITVYALPVGVLMFLEVLMLIVKGPFAKMGAQPADVQKMLDLGQSTKAIGMVMFTKYLLPFEIISVVLLVGFIGAVVLTVKEKKGE